MMLRKALLLSLSISREMSSRAKTQTIRSPRSSLRTPTTKIACLMNRFRPWNSSRDRAVAKPEEVDAGNAKDQRETDLDLDLLRALTLAEPGRLSRI
jgi:hypothetical protein